MMEQRPEPGIEAADHVLYVVPRAAAAAAAAVDDDNGDGDDDASITVQAVAFSATNLD